MSKASFAALRAKNSNIDDIKKKFESLNSSNKFGSQLEDETFWTMKHIRNEDGKGTSVIRLLPAPPNENDPFVYWYEYAHKGPGGWYINRSRQTLGANEKDPAYEYNGSIFSMGLSKEETQKRLMQRNVKYVYNILVIKDPNKKENEGKVFRWAVGPQIHKLIEAALFPEFGGEPINVFDPIDGANFSVNVYTKNIPGRDGKMVPVPSYEKSAFQSPSPLCDLEDFDEIWNRQYSLAELVAEDKFKPYDELVKEFNRAMKIESDEEDQPVKEAKTGKSKQIDIDDEIPWDVEPEATVEESTASEPEEVNEETSDNDNDVDDWLNSLK